METKEKIKKKGKRSISIVTVFLWIILVLVMTVITVMSFEKSNALESEATGLAITFNKNTAVSESYYEANNKPLSYIEIYYEKDGKTYLLGKYGGAFCQSIAGKTIYVPSDNFYIDIYCAEHALDNTAKYYGFSIDNI